MNLPSPTSSQGGWVRADPPQRPVLFINPVSGGGKARRARLAETAAEHGIEPVVLTPGKNLGGLVEEAVAGGADALGMVGGDGSVGVMAAGAHAHGLPFACVPAGTRNHFARDLGVPPNDLVSALDAFADGLERRIDLGDVNGRLFLNNVTLGICGIAVQRASYRKAKLRTLLETAQEVLGPSGELPAVRLVDDLGVAHTDPAVVLVSNNPYAPHRPQVPGMRPALDGGRLGVLVLHKPGDPRRRARPRLDRAIPSGDSRRNRGRRRGRRGDPALPASSFRHPAEGAPRPGFPRPHAHQLTRTSTSTQSLPALLSRFSRTSSATGTVTSSASVLNSSVPPVVRA